MTIRRTLSISAAATAFMAIAPGLGAQAPTGQPAQQPGAQPSQGAELVFEREVFDYPSFTRRNPFRPWDAGLAGNEGIRFEDLSLIGIMYSPDAVNSVAVVSTGGVTVNEDGTTSPVAGDAFYLKVGQRIGNTTVVQIRRDAVLVDVQEFDAVERRTMNFVSRRQGGTP
jgi:hypothetical protein